MSTQTTMFGERCSAVVSPHGAYRYRLSRIWDDAAPLALWVMLNPSTADAEVDDPTIRRVRAFTKAAGCGGFEVVNLFALRATDPKEMLASQMPFGPDNDEHIRGAIRETSGPIVCAWGAFDQIQMTGRQSACGHIVQARNTRWLEVGWHSLFG